DRPDTAAVHELFHAHEHVAHRVPVVAGDQPSGLAQLWDARHDRSVVHTYDPVSPTRGARCRKQRETGHDSWPLGTVVGRMIVTMVLAPVTASDRWRLPGIGGGPSAVATSELCLSAIDGGSQA